MCSALGRRHNAGAAGYCTTHGRKGLPAGKMERKEGSDMLSPAKLTVEQEDSIAVMMMLMTA